MKTTLYSELKRSSRKVYQLPDWFGIFCLSYTLEKFDVIISKSVTEVIDGPLRIFRLSTLLGNLRIMGFRKSKQLLIYLALFPLSTLLSTTLRHFLSSYFCIISSSETLSKTLINQRWKPKQNSHPLLSSCFRLRRNPRAFTCNLKA